MDTTLLEELFKKFEPCYLIADKTTVLNNIPPDKVFYCDGVSKDVIYIVPEKRDKRIKVVFEGGY